MRGRKAGPKHRRYGGGSRNETEGRLRDANSAEALQVVYKKIYDDHQETSEAHDLLEGSLSYAVVPGHLSVYQRCSFAENSAESACSTPSGPRPMYSPTLCTRGISPILRLGRVLQQAQRLAKV